MFQQPKIKEKNQKKIKMIFLKEIVV